jgi:mono/diheme cytochrome c family protein
MKKWTTVMVVILALFLTACGGGDTSSAGDVDQATINLGKTVFQANCSACHSATSDAVLVGPSLQKIADWGGSMVAGMDAYEYTKESILEPDAYITEGFQDLMPKTYSSTLTEKQIEAVIQYLLSTE